jgi:hypothetical protein
MGIYTDVKIPRLSTDIHAYIHFHTGFDGRSLHIGSPHLQQANKSLLNLCYILFALEVCLDCSKERDDTCDDAVAKPNHKPPQAHTESRSRWRLKWRGPRKA